MSEVLEYAARLSQVIGARPSGTEEEQQASFFIEETLQKQAGLETQIEEFNCNPNYELPRIVCCIVIAVLGILTLFLQLMVIPAFVITLVLAILFALEVIGISPLNNTSKRGISQNVIAKYFPGADAAAGADALMADGSTRLEGLDGASPRGGAVRGGRANARKRKIVLIARYDSGRVCRELKPPFLKILDYLYLVEIIGVALVPLALLVRMISNADGALLIILNIFVAIGIVVSLIPIIIYAMHQTAPWSDGANNNASGVAVMLEVATRIAKSAKGLPVAPSSAPHRVDDADDLIVMHGEDAITESGMLPVGTDLIYDEAAQGTLPDMEAMEARTIAIGEEYAAEPVTDGDAVTIPVGGDAFGAAADALEAASTQVAANAATAEAAVEAAVSQAVTVPVTSAATSFSSVNNTKSDVPDWFKKGIAKANAKKEAQDQDDDAPIQRSRFADALDAAAQASEGSIQEFAQRENARSAAAASAQPAYASPWQPASAKEVPERELAFPWPPVDKKKEAEREAAAASNTSAIAAIQASIAARADAAKRNIGDEEAAFAAGKQAEAEAIAEAAVIEDEAAAAAAADPNATGELSPIVAAAVGEAQAKEAADLVQSVEAVVEKAATADRTISFIPVAAEIPPEVSAADAVGSVDPIVSDTLAKTPGEILADATAMAEEAADGVSSRQSHKRTISLPSLTGAIEAVSTSSQAAPLAEDAERGAGSDRLALAKIVPTTDPMQQKGSPREKAQAAKVAKAAKSKKAKAAEAAPAKKVTGIPALDGVTEAETVAFGSSSFEPVSDELIASMVEDDIVVHDVDDSDYEVNTTVAGAPTRGYVEMPKTRTQRIKGIFGRNKKQYEETSFSEAMGLDADFDARKVGAERGSWESFQNESADYDAANAASTAAGAAAASARKSASGTRASGSHASSAREGRSSGSSRRGSHSRPLDEDDSRETRTRRSSRKDSWDDDAWADDGWSGGAFSLSRIGDAVKGVAGGGDGDGRSKRRGSGDSGTTDGKQRRKNPGDMLASLAQEAEAEVAAAGSAYAAAGDVDEGGGRRRSRSTSASGRTSGRIAPEDMIDEREEIRSFRASSAMLTSFEDVAAFAGSVSASMAADAGLAEDEGDMRDLAQPQGFQTEVWFVALGAQLADNAGVKAFLAEHAPDLRGAVVIELEAMGAGTLSLIEEEGMVRHVKAPSRMKRYVTKAGSALGLRINGVKTIWRETAAYFAARKGLQTVHVAGMDGAKPAYLGEAKDQLDILDEDKLLENAAFVLELMHSI